jgi:metal-dependent amidase/aminoacylase/carboxypeptidase family protein
VDESGLQEQMVRLRRPLHADPEVGLDLPATQAKVVEALSSLSLEADAGRLDQLGGGHAPR